MFCSKYEYLVYFCKMEVSIKKELMNLKKEVQTLTDNFLTHSGNACILIFVCHDIWIFPSKLNRQDYFFDFSKSHIHKYRFYMHLTTRNLEDIAVLIFYRHLSNTYKIDNFFFVRFIRVWCLIFENLKRSFSGTQCETFFGKKYF